MINLVHPQVWVHENSVKIRTDEDRISVVWFIFVYKANNLVH